MTITDYLAGLKIYANGLSVIYAEDDQELASQVMIFLQKFFDDIRLCDDGELALDEYKKRTCDILITDIVMPNMDGIELSSKVVDMNAVQKIIVISAYNESDKLIKLINIGVEKFLLKPFDNRLFLRALYTVCKEIYDPAFCNRNPCS
jgi:DNA-binding response OmpR family regulator